MKIPKAKRGIKTGILIVTFFFALFTFFPSISVADDSASGGESGGGATQDLATLEILGLGVLGIFTIVFLVEALDDDDVVVPTHGAHGAHHGGHH